MSRVQQNVIPTPYLPGSAPGATPTQHPASPAGQLTSQTNFWASNPPPGGAGVGAAAAPAPGNQGDGPALQAAYDAATPDDDDAATPDPNGSNLNESSLSGVNTAASTSTSGPPANTSSSDIVNSLASADAGFAASAAKDPDSRHLAVLQSYVAEVKKGGSDPWGATAGDIKKSIGSGDTSWVDGAINDAKGIIDKDPTASRLNRDGYPDVAGQIAAAKTSIGQFDPSSYKQQDKDLIDKVANTPGLDPHNLGNYVSILGSNTPGIGANARSAASSLFSSGKTPSSGAIDDLFSKGDYLTNYRPLPSGSFVTPSFTKSTNRDQSQTYQVSIDKTKTQVDVSSKGSTSDGNRDLYTFKLRGHTLNVTYPKGADTSGKNGVTSLDTLAQNFAAQTDADLDSASHETFAVQTNNTGNYATTDHSGYIRLYAGDAANNVNFTSPALSHELGHAAQFNEGSSQNTSDYANAIASDNNKPSGYARTNATEDFAETWALYQDVKGTPNEAIYRNLYPGRFAVIDRINGALTQDGAKTGPAGTSD